MRALAALAGVDPGRQPGRTPGKPPRLEWLALAALRIDDTYQRDITARSEANIRRIAQAFSWSRFSPLIVMQQGSVYAVIDGQHRATAALSLGYDKVPCAIVDARPGDAAAIFAAINGDVTAMTPLALFKAARAAGADWAMAIDRACRAAGVTPLTYPVPASKQKPLMTMSVGTMKQVVVRHGENVLAAALLCLARSDGSDLPGFLTTGVIRACASLFLTRPAWLADPAAVAAQFATVSPLLLGFAAIEAMLVKRLGDGSSTPAARSELRAKVQDLKTRRFSQTMVAATLHLPYAEVARLWDTP